MKKSQTHKIWETPSMPVILGENEAHIWKVNIEKLDYDPEFYREILSPEECNQADRFSFERDRIRHTITHGILRLLISKYLLIKPRDIFFNSNNYRKPELLKNYKGKKLCFNLSHSEFKIVYAFSWNREIGIDIEKIRAMEDTKGLIERFFSEREKNDFFSLPIEIRTKAFFTFWTRKEAYIKARGDGLSFPLDHFSISCNPDDSPMLIEVKNEPFEKERWSFHEIILDEDYCGTLAIEGNEIKLRFLQWQG